MAVPKKRLSKTKTRTRKSNWKKKGLKHVTKALSLAKSLKKNPRISLLTYFYSNLLKNW